jgi:UDP:flavonoid glycosyltransferase YjiC (YdhE family)
MRILFSSQPLFGHVNTMVPQALAAQRAGHEVVFATGASMAAHVEGHGLDVWRVGPASAPRGSGVDWISFFLESARSRSETMLPLVKNWRPDIVIHEETELAGAVAAAAVSAGHVVHGLGVMPPMRIWDVWADAIESLALEWGVALADQQLRDATYLEVCPPALQPPGERIWHRVQPLRHSTGPARSGEHLPDHIESMPHHRLAHLTLGTVFNDATAVLEAAIAGLRDLPVNLVVTTGPGTDPAVLGDQPDNVLITPYVSHSLLLPRCDLVVSHAGAGIMFGALTEGIPQLALPPGADQDMNASALVESGAGLMLERGDVSAERITDVASRLLTESSFAASADVVRRQIETMPEPSDVIADLTVPAGRLTLRRRS